MSNKNNKSKKSAVYQWSGDISRIIPMGGTFARVTDELGKSKNYSRDSIEFKEECARLDSIMDGKISIELANLGWDINNV